VVVEERVKDTTIQLADLVKEKEEAIRDTHLVEEEAEEVDQEDL